MTRFYLSIGCILTGIFALALVSVRLQPVDNRVAHYFEGCSVACWYGVAPGVTSGEDAVARLTEVYGVSLGRVDCYYDPSDRCDNYLWRTENSEQEVSLTIQEDIVSGVDIRPANLTFGEALVAFSNRQNGLYSIYTYYMPRSALAVWMTFDETRVGMTTTVLCPATYITLMNTPMTNISVSLPHKEWVEENISGDFAEFHRIWRRSCTPSS